MSVVIILYGLIYNNFVATSSIEGEYTINGVPQVDKSIWLINYDSEERWEIKTSKTGSYRLDGISAGGYYIGTYISTNSITNCTTNNILLESHLIPTKDGMAVAIEPPKDWLIEIYSNQVHTVNFNLDCE